MRLLQCILISFSLTASLQAQSFEDYLDKWANSNPIQKVHLHLDKEIYAAGQTVWFKAYFMAEFLPSQLNSTVYVELLNAASRVVDRKILPVINSSAIGQFDMSDTLSSGTYLLRAYTPLMLNQNQDYLYSKPIQVFGKQPVKEAGNIGKNIAVQFFPEGGNLITSLANRVAFKATTEQGLPADVSGEVKNSKGAGVAVIKTIHDGMGVFDMTPAGGEKYYAEINGRKYDLPDATKNGIAFSIDDEGAHKRFTIQELADNGVFQAAFMIGQIQNKVLFRQELNIKNNRISGRIPVNSIPSGVLHITVFNKNNMPLAERLTFIDNKEYILPASIITDSLNSNARSGNIFLIAMKDSVSGNFSVSVTDADYDGNEVRPQNIYSSFLLTGDIPAYVHNPGYYFSSAANSLKQDLDLVMMTNGWRRFKWTDVVSNNLPSPVYKDPGYISFSGQVNIRGRKVSLPNTSLMFVFNPVDTAIRTLKDFKRIKTDEQGNFKFDSLLFYGATKILVRNIDKKPRPIKLQIDENPINKTYNLQNISFPHKLIPDLLSSGGRSIYEDHINAQGKLLETVTVKARTKTPLEQLEDEYITNPVFKRPDAVTIDLTNEVDPSSAGAMAFFEWLKMKVPSIKVISDDKTGVGLPGEVKLYYRANDFLGGAPMVFLLDEQLASWDDIAFIPISEMALIKIYDGNNKMPGDLAGGGTVSVYTKRGRDIPVNYQKEDSASYNGYSVVKEFYSPDYSVQSQVQQPDNRTTLHWLPGIEITATNPVIPIMFYNNDRTKKFRIVVEGLTADGRIVMAEKIISP